MTGRGYGRAFGRRSALCAAALLASGAAVAAEAPDAGRALESVRPPPRIEKPAEVPELERQVAKPAMKANGTAIPVSAFRVTGATRIAPEELERLLDDLKGRDVTLDEINKALARIQEAYAELGYFLAIAYVPAQEIRDGVVEIAVLEGRLGEVSVAAAEGARADGEAVRRTVGGAAPAGEVIDKARIERGLLLSQDLPGVDIKATLVPGATVGTADLKVDVKDAPLVSGLVELDTFGNRYTGRERLGALVSVNNPTGLNDRVSLRAVSSFQGLNYFRIGYTVPVGYQGTRLGGSYSRTEYRLCCRFDDLDAEGDAQVAGLQVLHPLVRSRERNLFLTAGVDQKSFYNRTAAGTTSDKRSQVLNLGISGDARDGWQGGGMTQFGADLALGRLDLDGHRPDKNADALSERKHGGFTKLAYNVSRLQSLARDWSLFASLSGQFASRNLDSSEKFVLGGSQGVRAYPQGEATGDEGHLLAVELRWDAPVKPLGADLQFVGFVDHGLIRLHRDTWAGWRGGNAEQRNRYGLTGAGIGVAFAKAGDFSVRAQYAWRVGGNPGRDALGHDSENGDDRGRLWLQLVKAF